MWHCSLRHPSVAGVREQRAAGFCARFCWPVPASIVAGRFWHEEASSIAIMCTEMPGRFGTAPYVGHK